MFNWVYVNEDTDIAKQTFCIPKTSVDETTVKLIEFALNKAGSEGFHQHWMQAQSTSEEEMKIFMDLHSWLANHPEFVVKSPFPTIVFTD